MMLLVIIIIVIIIIIIAIENKIRQYKCNVTLGRVRVMLIPPWLA
jgi:hypothetical protein